MPNLKEVRTRIASVKSTQQITKAMKMVSAAKLRRAQTKIQEMRPYAVKMRELLGNVSGNVEGSESARFYENKAGKTLYVLITADRGLCGSFNSGLVKSLKARLQKSSEYTGPEALDVYCIGKKGHDAMKRIGANVVKSHDGFFTNFGFEEAEQIADELMELYDNGEYATIYIAYNHFKNAATYLNTFECWLPIAPEEEEVATDNNVDYIFEPDKVAILDEMVPRSLKIALFKGLLDSNASEHGARMTAMDSATDNAQDLLKNLSIEYNKARQAAITKEILEIVGGADALES